MGIEITGMAKARRAIDPKIYAAAERSAVGWVTSKGKTSTVKSVSKKFNVTQGQVSRLVRKWTSGKKYEAAGFLAMRRKGKGIGLLNFGAKGSRGRIQTKLNRKSGGVVQIRTKRASRNQGVSFKILRGGRMRRRSDAFIVRGQRGTAGDLSWGNAQVFVRGSSGLIPMRVIELSSMFDQNYVFARLNDLVKENFPTRLKHEINRRVGK